MSVRAKNSFSLVLGSLCSLSIGLCLPMPAHSGAYLENRGMGLLMMDARIDQARVAFSSSGHPSSALIYNRLDMITSVELGVSERVTLLLSAGGTKASYEDASQYSYYVGRSVSEIGARFKLVRGADWILSAQATTLLPDGACSCISAISSDTMLQQDSRLMIGKNFNIGTRYPLYAEIQIGERFRQSNSTETHIDASLAWRPRVNVMLLAQSFWTQAPLRAQAPLSAQTPRLNRFKQEISVIYDFSRYIAFRLGVFDTLFGQNTLSEHGVVMGMWLHF